MKLSDYTYHLPEERIAKHPPKQRGDARLLVLHRSSGKIEHKKYGDIVDYVNRGDLVIRNNTQVIKARLLTKNKNGDGRELLLTERHGTNDPHTHKALHRGKLHLNEKLYIGKEIIKVKELFDDGSAIISASKSFKYLTETYGEVPLPPYLKRTAQKEDTERYQTVFASKAGSVAAPTASLNFTKKVENNLVRKGTAIADLTLHVGLGTFMPIRENDLKNHKMHSEYFIVPSTTVSSIQSVKTRKNKVFAIGTTVTRTLEFCRDLLLDKNEQKISGEADIFIYPGYEFKIVDALLTNFHAPKSTVLMMAAAFAGWENLYSAYQEALKENYAFLSYGDSMLII